MPLVSKTLEVDAESSTIPAIVADFEAYPHWNDEVKAVWVLARYDDGRPSQLRSAAAAAVSAVRGSTSSAAPAVPHASPAVSIRSTSEQGR